METETEEQKKRWVFTQAHYRELAKWMERVALLLLGSMVLQNVIDAFSLAKPVVVGELVLTAISYYLALTFLHKS